MNIEKYTERARGFIQSAQSLAMRDGHQQFSTLHLLKVLLDDNEGRASGLIDRAGGNSRAILTATEEALNKQPKVSGSGAGHVYLAPELARAFDAAEKAAEKAGDSFVTVERLLLGLAIDTNSEAGAIRSKGGVTAQNLNAAIEALRKGRAAPALARGELHCIGATTLDEYQKHVEKDPALARRFQPIYVGEPTVEDTISILRGLKDKYKQHHGVRITDSALVAATTLSNRYITDRFLPDKAIDLMDEAAARLKMQVDSKPEELDLLDRDIIRLTARPAVAQRQILHPFAATAS